MFGAANGGLDREWLVDRLVIESLVVDRSALDISCVSDPSFRTKGIGSEAKVNEPDSTRNSKANEQMR